MQIQVNSTNVLQFGFTCKFDIYNRKIILDTTNLTTYNGAGASAVKIAFSVQDQDGVDLSVIDFTNPSNYIVPSVNKILTIDLSSLNYSFLFQTYKIVGTILDGGTQYSTPSVIKNVCTPTGINDNGYVPGIFQVIPDCTANTMTVKELTLLTYNNLTPSSKTVNGAMNYPTGTIAAIPFTSTPFVNNQLYSGRYMISCTTVAEYDLGDGVYVDVSYITSQQFDVTCSNRMADLICCIRKYEKDYQSDCLGAKGKAAKQKLDLITIPFLTGLVKEINGQDASDEADYIKETLDCDCGSDSVSQNQLNPINPNFSIVLVGGGDVTIPSPVINGNTKQYTISSNLYQVTKNDNTDLGFSITTDNSTPNTVRYKIAFNYSVIASSVLNSIGASPTMQAQLNSLVTSAFNIAGLNGSCVIDLTKSSYTLSQSVNGATTITSITINGTIYNAPSNLNVNTTINVQNWLNSLSLGTYVVSINNSVLTILSVNNTNVPSSIALATPNVVVPFVSTSATLVSVLQAIINYLCQLTTLQVALANSLSLSLFDYSGNPITVQYPNGTPQANFNLGISQAINNIVSRISQLTGVTCSTLKAIFVDAPGVQWQVTDRLFGTLNGNCAGLTDQQVANLVIAAIGKYADVKTAFCAISCATPGTCPDVSALNLGISGSNIALYGLTWTQNPAASQTVSVKYRVHGQTAWIVSSNSVTILPNGNVSSNPPYLITGPQAGQSYDVWIQNNCGGNGFISQVTVPTAQVYSGSYKRDNSIYLICGDSPVTLYTSQPFATGVTMYVNAGLTTPLTGYTYIADSTGAIYNINSTTGVVGTATGSNCNNGTPHSYILGNATNTICGNTTQTLYTNGAFAVGGTLYNDAALTSPVTGFSYVVNMANNHIYNLNNVTGAIGADTGLSCNSNTVIISTDSPQMQIVSVSGISGFTGSGAPFPLSAGQSATGTHNGFTGQISVAVTGTPPAGFNPSGLVLSVNGTVIQELQMIGPGTYIFNSITVVASDLIRVDGIIGL